MKKFFLLYLCSCGVLLSAENLLVNGSFEEGLNAWTNPGWLKNATVPELEKTDMPGPGSGALKLSCAEGKRAYISQRFSIPPGKRYLKISFLLKTKDLEKSWGACLVLLDNVKLPVWKQSTYPSLFGKKESPWTKFEGTFSVPEGAGPKGTIAFSIDPKQKTGSLLVDDVSIIPLDGPPKTEPEVRTSSGKGVRSGLNMLSDKWEDVSGKSGRSADKSGNGELSFSPGSGQTAGAVQRLSSIRWNCDGMFRFSCRVRTEGKILPAITISAVPWFTVKRKPQVFAAKPSGKEKDGWTEYVCEFVALPKTAGISISLGNGNASGSSKIVFRDLCFEPMVVKSDSISVWDAVPGGEQGIFPRGSAPWCDFYFMNSYETERSVPLKIGFSDYFGKKCGEAEKTLILPAMSITKHRICFPEKDKPGFYAMTVKWGTGESKSSCVIVDSPPVQADPFFGITMMGPTEENVRAMKLMGVGKKGILFNWKTIEKADGSFDWEAADRDVDACRKAGIEVVGGFLSVSGRGPDHYKENPASRAARGLPPYSDEYYQAAARFESAVVSRYKDRIREWTVANEINLTKDQNPYEYDHYIRRLKNSFRAVKEADPKAVFTGIGCSGGDGRSMPRFPVLCDLYLNRGLHDYLDGVGLDQYSAPQTYGPGYRPVDSESGMMREIMLDALSIVRSKGMEKCLAIDEKGFNLVQSLPVDTPYGRDLADILAREYVVLKSIPEIRHWLYFMWRQWRPGEKIDWGLWLYNHPRQAVSAYAATARIVGNARFAMKMDLHGNVPCYLFTKNGKTIVALWYNGMGEASLLLDLPGDGAMLDVQGNPMSLQRELKLTGSPVYLLTDASPEVVAKALGKADVSLAEVNAALNMVKDGEVEVIVENLTRSRLSLNVAVGSVKQRLELPPRDIRTLTFCGSFGNPVRAEIVTGKGRSYLFSEKFSIYRIPEVAGAGDVRKLKPFACLDNAAEHMSNVDYVSAGLWTGPEDCSAELRAGYDRENFYLHVLVKDEFHWNGYRNAMIWAGDSIQCAFDFLRDGKLQKLKGKPGFIEDDVFFTAALANGEAQIFSHDPVKKNLPRPNIIRNESQKTTEYFVTVPWRVMPSFKPEKGRIFGFNVTVLDSDQENQMAPYWMQLTPGIAGGQRPEEFSGFLLE